MSLIDLTGRSALVTGGSRGIGAATVRLLSRAGASVAFSYRTREEDARALADECGARCFQADLSTSQANRELVDSAVDELGRLDFFVANAGIWPAEEVAVGEMSDERWSRTLSVNLDSVFFGCRAALGSIEEEGAVVIVGSTAGQRGEAWHADYAATKGALISFVKSLAVEAAPEVTVNCVAPGWVDTEMSAIPYADGGRERIAAGIPMGRVASPEEVAGPIVFLCSPLARHITGEVLNVNGGSVLCG